MEQQPYLLNSLLVTQLHCYLHYLYDNWNFNYYLSCTGIYMLLFNMVSLNYWHFYNNLNEQLYYRCRSLIQHAKIIAISIIICSIYHTVVGLTCYCSCIDHTLNALKCKRVIGSTSLACTWFAILHVQCTGTVDTLLIMASSCILMSQFKNRYHLLFHQNIMNIVLIFNIVNRLL